MCRVFSQTETETDQVKGSRGGGLPQGTYQYVVKLSSSLASLAPLQSVAGKMYEDMGEWLGRNYVEEVDWYEIHPTL